MPSQKWIYILFACISPGTVQDGWEIINGYGAEVAGSVGSGDSGVFNPGPALSKKINLVDWEESPV
jgi:hypothetical protein